MSQNVTFAGTTYSIPETGETGWGDLTDFLVSVATNAQVSAISLSNIRSSAGAAVTVAADDSTIVCTATGAVTCTLPVAADGRFLTFILGPNATQLTLTPSGSDTIQGGASFVFKTIKGAIQVQFESGSPGDWRMRMLGASQAATETEIGYVAGVTSGIQAQLNGKHPTITTSTTLAVADITLTGMTGSVITSASAETSITELDGGLYDAGLAGFVSYAGTSPYFTRIGTSLTQNGGGIGRLSSKKITFAGAQNVTLTTGPAVDVVYVNSSGVLAKKSSWVEADARVGIALYQVYNDGTNYWVAKENHEYHEFSAGGNFFLHRVLGGVVQIVDGSTECIISAVSTSKVAITAGVIEDHGLESTCAVQASGATWSFMYVSGGQLLRYSSASNVPAYFNSSGTPSALTGTPSTYGVYSFYLIKDDGNTGSTAQYIALMQNKKYSSQANAQADINAFIAGNALSTAGAITNIVGAFLVMEPVQVGFCIVDNAGTVVSTTVSRSTIGARYVGGSSGTAGVASGINTNVTNFNGVLSAADVTVQSALDTIDNMLVSGITTPSVTGATSLVLASTTTTTTINAGTTFAVNVGVASASVAGVSIAATGACTWGPAGFAGGHVINGFTTITKYSTTIGGEIDLTDSDGTTNWSIGPKGTAGSQLLNIKCAAVVTATCTPAGAWTLGLAAASVVRNTIYGHTLLNNSFETAYPVSGTPVNGDKLYLYSSTGVYESRIWGGNSAAGGVICFGVGGSSVAAADIIFSVNSAIGAAGTTYSPILKGTAVGAWTWGVAGQPQTLNGSLVTPTQATLSDNVSVAGKAWAFYNTNAPLTVNGLSGGVTGQFCVIMNDGVNTVTLAYNNAGGTQKFMTPNNANIVMVQHTQRLAFFGGTFWHILGPVD